MARFSKSATLWSLAIVFFSGLLGLWVHWQAPGLARYSHDWLMRFRGALPVPGDIAIVAIDEASIRRFGRFPWPRDLTAQALDRLSAAQPKVIAADILYPDPTTDAGDQALAQSISKAGNVVLSAQLIEANGGAAWLKPLPALESVAAGVGHANVATESDGVARYVLVRAADDDGLALRALAIETIRVGDSIASQAVRDTPAAFLLGPRSIPVEAAPAALVVSPAAGSRHAPEVLRAGRMAIDYIGPSGAFASRTYSFADLLDGKLPRQAFQGKYVLLGATAASLGDRLASPFVHQQDREGNQHGSLMPGVEVLANSVNTILRSRFYSETSDFTAFLLSALAAALTLALLSLAQGRREVPKQFGVLVALGAGIVLTGYLVFRAFLIDPPLVPELAAFAAAGVLGLLRRSLATSARLDSAIAEISQAGADLVPLGGAASAAAAIARLSEAAGVTILATDAAGQNRVAASVGGQLAPRLSANRALAGSVDGSHRLVTVPLREDNHATGILALLHAPGQEPSPETLEICGAIAASAIANAEPAEPGSPLGAPKGVEWKARALGQLNARLIQRSGFIGAALRSVDDGLLIATADGRITFANRRAAAMLAYASPALAGHSLFRALDLDERAMLRRILMERGTVEREIFIPDPKPRHYMLRLAGVSSSGAGQHPVLGIVATLSDVTRQHELRQTQNDVMALVSHEMRTPLTAIQGMSELLAKFDVDPERRREMHTVINDEVKRLSRMINDYLDLARLESGAVKLHLSPLRIPAILERAVLLLDPIAALKNIRLVRNFAPDTPVLLADSDLVARAVSNLVSNAIKYSPNGTEVTIASAPAAGGGVRIDVADQGFGIPAADLDRIFDKFFRVARVQDEGAPGTGLGLALVRDVAELHGGAVTVKSAAGAGSTFTLLLPGGEQDAG